MRSELERLEQIDQYLSGKMTPNQASAFEAQMNADPALKSMVQDQQLLIQTVSRTAMMAEIKAVAGIAAGAAAGGGAASAGWGLTQWIVVGVTAVGATVGGVAIYNSVTEDSNEVVEETINPENNNSALIAEETYDTSEIFAFDMIVDEDDEDDVEVEMVDVAVNENEDLSDNGSNNRDNTNNSNNDPLNEFSTLNRNQPDNETAEYDESDSGESHLVKNRTASFKGGHVALEAHFANNLTYPGTAMKEKVQGTVEVTIMIGRDGKIEVINSEMISLFDEKGKLLTGLQRSKHRKAIKKFEGNAERAFRICPHWLPATNTSGSPRQSTQTWHVKFNLHGKSEVFSFGEDSGYVKPNSELEGVHDYSDSEIFFEVQTIQYDLSEPTNK